MLYEKKQENGYGDMAIFELHTRLILETRRSSYGHLELPAWRMDDCMKTVFQKVGKSRNGRKNNSIY